MVVLTSWAPMIEFLPPARFAQVREIPACHSRQQDCSFSKLAKAVHRNSTVASGPQLPAKGAVLEGREERIHLRQRRALRRLQLIHFSYSAGKFAL